MLDRTSIMSFNNDSDICALCEDRINLRRENRRSTLTCVAGTDGAKIFSFLAKRGPLKKSAMIGSIVGSAGRLFDTGRLFFSTLFLQVRRSRYSRFYSFLQL